MLDVDQHGQAGNGFAAFNRLKRAGLIADSWGGIATGIWGGTTPQKPDRL